ncbi:hypothetical protein B0H13DRAFT_2265642 [Mycena leptocephala]|nr:hypothetical protein B0H13DRAFT_2265642 [Mycena leptocephala]
MTSAGEEAHKARREGSSVRTAKISVIISRPEVRGKFEERENEGERGEGWGEKSVEEGKLNASKDRSEGTTKRFEWIKSGIGGREDRMETKNGRPKPTGAPEPFSRRRRAVEGEGTKGGFTARKSTRESAKPGSESRASTARTRLQQIESGSTTRHGGQHAAEIASAGEHRTSAKEKELKWAPARRGCNTENTESARKTKEDKTHPKISVYVGTFYLQRDEGLHAEPDGINEVDDVRGEGAQGA